MKLEMVAGSLLLVCCLYPPAESPAKQGETAGLIARFAFNGDVASSAEASAGNTLAGNASFVGGLEGEALRLEPSGRGTFLRFDDVRARLDPSANFSLRYWVRTTSESDRRFAIVSQKQFADNSLASQKQPGWVFYMSDGTWAWNMGSDGRRITYERDNGEHMPVNDGRWHQLAMTYDSARSEVRLFYDGYNKAIYNVSDSTGFDFSSSAPLAIGWPGSEPSPTAEIVPAIYTGADKLQQLVDTFNAFGLDELRAEELVHLIVDPRRLFDEKVEARSAGLAGAERTEFLASMQTVDFEPISEIEDELMDNPYTVHQALSFMEAAPLMKIFSLVEGRIVIDEDVARAFTDRERLYPPAFDIDNLEVWDRALSADEVLDSYAAYFEPVDTPLEADLSSITVGAWNIFHGGKHFTIPEHGWDSRRAIAEILKQQDIDVLMMQETYSSGDFIAAELGYYFATTADRDYLNQGANISVLSRYPIKEIYVEADSAFMNVAAKLAISETQDFYAMSNWYGMQQFPAVFGFHEVRFAESDNIPTVFAGDFNAVPHTDGGDSPASPVMQNAGFTDAFRSAYPDVATHPGPTHRNGRRIDQLYFKGAGLRNTSTRLITTWPTGFPSDHNLIRSTFELDYVTAGSR